MGTFRSTWWTLNVSHYTRDKAWFHDLESSIVTAPVLCIQFKVYVAIRFCGTNLGRGILAMAGIGMELQLCIEVISIMMKTCLYDNSKWGEEVEIEEIWKWRNVTWDSEKYWLQKCPFKNLRTNNFTALIHLSFVGFDQNFLKGFAMWLNN